MGAEENSWRMAPAAEEEAKDCHGGTRGGGDTDNPRNQSDVMSSNSSSSISVDTSLSLPEMKPLIIDLCKDLFEKWSSLDNSHFSIETVSGGITNLLLKVTVKDASANEVPPTVRLYGPNTDLVIDRKRELQALPHLSAAGFGAKLLGLFANGMVESFINARTLENHDMWKPRIAAEIAKQLHEFHQVEIPGSRESQLWIDIFKFLDKG